MWSVVRLKLGRHLALGMLGRVADSTLMVRLGIGELLTGVGVTFRGEGGRVIVATVSRAFHFASRESLRG